MERLTGRSVVVTGVGSGLGTAIAHEFAAQGAQVLGCDVDDAAGEAAMEGRGLFQHADVSREADVAELVAAAVRSFERLDVMVNNAAVQIEAEVTETTEAQLDLVLGVNLKGVFFGCKHAVRAMRATGGGSIVNVASVLALVGSGMLAAYCAAKAGVLGITRATAIQYGADGIRCNVICPGDIDTPLLHASLGAGADADRIRAEVEHVYPIGRIAHPHEIARSVVFLASDDSCFMSGQPLVVDGGLLANCYRLAADNAGVG